ncbi:hypothetical protein [Escherichia coli]|uniref:hypothetical protein n=1 Tax=Escherichia coli TaxID=562 RepID=UPI002FCD546D
MRGEDTRINDLKQALITKSASLKHWRQVTPGYYRSGKKRGIKRFASDLKPPTDEVDYGI